MIEFFSRKNWMGKRRYYFRVLAFNYEILCQSEGYNTRAGRNNGFDALSHVFDRLFSSAVSIKDLDKPV